MYFMQNDKNNKAKHKIIKSIKNKSINKNNKYIIKNKQKQKNSK